MATFDDSRITNAQKTANSSMNTYNQYAKQADAAGNKYNTAFDDRQNYGDIYQQARDQYMNTDEINAARGTYQGARDAVDQMNATINKLPESIRQQYGGTGLTEAQRARAMSDQYSQNSNTMNLLNTNYQNASADYQDLANRALQEVFNVAGGNYQSQEDALNALQSAWGTLLGQRNTAYSQNQTDRGLVADQYSARDAIRLANDQNALERWKEQQANARAAADRASQFSLQKYLMDRQAEMNAASKPTAPKVSNVSAPTRDIGNDKIDDAAMYKSWQEAPLWQRIASAPLMMFNGY